MHLALTDLYRARWTDAIHDEWTRNVLKDRPNLKPEQLKRTRELINVHVRDCLVTGYEDLVSSLELPDADDRHVLAAAIRSGADVIVTFDIKDFPAEALAPFGIEALHPDDFLTFQIDLALNIVCAAARRHRTSLKSPPKNVDEYLLTLEAQGLVKTVSQLRRFAELI